jgi:hypothetical protein
LEVRLGLEARTGEIGLSIPAVHRVRKTTAPRGGGIRGGRERSLRVGGSAVVDWKDQRETPELVTRPRAR